MTDFDDSRWAKEEFAHLYIEHADIYIPERPTFSKFLEYFYSYYFKDKKDVKVLDLGAGDGTMMERLLKNHNPKITITDGSTEMIEAAKKKLSPYDSSNDIDYICSTFEEILKTNMELTDFDLIISSLAIHHLTRPDKKLLYKYIFDHLKPNGYFINMDVALSPSLELEDWYIDIRKKRSLEVREIKKLAGSEEFADDFIKRHKDPDHHKKMDTLLEQLEDIKETGFKNVDCYFKHGMFVIYGGQKI